MVQRKSDPFGRGSNLIRNLCHRRRRRKKGRRRRRSYTQPCHRCLFFNGSEPNQEAVHTPFLCVSRWYKRPEEKRFPKRAQPDEPKTVQTPQFCADCNHLPGEAFVRWLNSHNSPGTVLASANCPTLRFPEDGLCFTCLRSRTGPSER